jgi:hypothetical protein
LGESNASRPTDAIVGQALRNEFSNELACGPRQSYEGVKIDGPLFLKKVPDTDLAWLHYATFIESIVVSLDEALFFDSEQFTNTSMNKLIEAKIK